MKSNEKKEYRITVRLSPEELNSIEAKAEAAHMALSTYIRACALRHKVVVVEGVKESAALIETDEQDEIYAGDAEYPEIPKTESDVKETSAEAKLALCLAMEKAAKEADERVWKVQRAMVSSGTSTIRMKNSYGLDLTDEGSYCMAYAAPIAKADRKTAILFDVCQFQQRRVSNELGDRSADIRHRITSIDEF